MSRDFIGEDDLAGLLREFRSGARLDSAVRLAGGSKKGVYRLQLADSSSLILCAWNEAENYWPPAESVPGDPFASGNAAGALAFRDCHAALTEAGVRVPELYALDLSRARYPADLALMEDAGTESLEDLLERDSSAAARPLAQLGEALRAMQARPGARYGTVAVIARAGDPPGPAGLAGPAADEPAEDVILRRALRHLELAAGLEPELAAVAAGLTELVLARRAAIRPRHQYCLVHGELGPDHVLLDQSGAPVIIDIEGLAYFDPEWEHAFLRLRFGADYPRLGPSAMDEARVAFYDLAQRISLVEGPLRIAATDYPDREWMLDCARWHTGRLLADVEAARAGRTAEAR
jgi:hypothetical protein